MRGSLVSTGLVVALAFVGAGCRDGRSSPDAPGASLRARPAERDSYRPPADGVLSAAQVETFLKVRAATIRSLSSPGASAPLEGEEGISGASEARASEIRAARSLAVPVEEYLWIRERVIEAETADLTAKLNADVLALLERTLASMRDRRNAATDDASRQLLDEQIASFEGEAIRVRREAAEREPTPVRANLRVIAPFRARLSTVADELAQLKRAAALQPSPK